MKRGSAWFPIAKHAPVLRSVGRGTAERSVETVSGYTQLRIAVGAQDCPRKVPLRGNDAGVGGRTGSRVPRHLSLSAVWREQVVAPPPGIGGALNVVTHLAPITVGGQINDHPGHN
jgi:hypothetical protein